MSDVKNNTGAENSGDYNNGYRNSGYCNSGDHNSGDRNSGDQNSGNYNSGDYNSGYRNSGNRNSGNYNSGDYNSGYHNSGNRNSGNYNSGDYNSGYHNSGNYNSGDYNSGLFNTNEPNARLFNKETNIKRSELRIPYIELKVTEWISEDKMTDQQKKDDPRFFVKKGTLIKREYKDAWKLAWSTLGEKTKNEFLALPNFDADIFFEITGVDVKKKEIPSCVGKIVEIDGKKYKLSEV